MALCEVDLGKGLLQRHSNGNAGDLVKSSWSDATSLLSTPNSSTSAVASLCHPEGPFGSVIAEGKHGPIGFDDFDYPTRVPSGPLTTLEDVPGGRSLLYNEYIIYETQRAKIRYLVEVDFGKDSDSLW